MSALLRWLGRLVQEVACFQLRVLTHWGIPAGNFLRALFEPHQTETAVLFCCNIFCRFGRGWRHVPVYEVFSAFDNFSVTSGLDILHHATD